MDGLKEFVDAFSTRVRSPVIGSVALAFLLYNWVAFAMLFFGNDELNMRIEVFKSAVGLPELLLSVFLGLSFAIALPWLNLLGAILVAKPMNLHGEYSDVWATKRSQKRTALAESLTLQAKAERDREVAEAEVATERRKAELAEMEGELEQRRLVLAKQIESGGIPFDLILQALDTTDRSLLKAARDGAGLEVKLGGTWTEVRGLAPGTQVKTAASQERAEQSLTKLRAANLLAPLDASELRYRMTEVGTGVARLI
jgi:hypothetical protein